jgi:hypothetical protein
LLWTGKSVRHIREELERQDFKVSHELIRQILGKQGYSLQTNGKTKEGGNHPDRNAQFEFTNSHQKYLSVIISLLYLLIARKKS